jgi:hypothetical protein
LPEVIQDHMFPFCLAGHEKDSPTLQKAVHPETYDGTIDSQACVDGSSTVLVRLTEGATITGLMELNDWGTASCPEERT